MENISVLSNKESKMNLPPGFRFHPTDEELITYYLFNKATRENFSAIAIAEVDIHKSEPWDLPWKAKMGDDEWYFFCLRDRKYPSSLRANRTTEAGHWKSTGRDGNIYRGKLLIGKKKTLVFYSGRAPTGEKTDWVMHEYRLDGKLSVLSSSRTVKNEWVICRVYQKASGGKKTHISGIKRLKSTGNGLGSSVSVSPPVVCYTPCYKGTVEPTMISNDPAYVSCFSSLPQVDQNNQAGIFNSAGNTLLGIRSNPRNPLHGWLYFAEPIQGPMNLPLPDSALTVQEQNFLDGVLENNGGFITEAENSVSHETDPTTTDMNPDMSSVMSIFDNLQNPSASSAASLDLDHFWSY